MCTTRVTGFSAFGRFCSLGFPSGFRGALLCGLIAALMLTGSGALSAAEGDVEFEDPLGRENPRSSLVGFLRAVDEDDLTLAAKYLDLRNLPADIAQYSPEELAAGLAIVLQRATWLDLETISEDSEGAAEDGQPSYRDLLVTLETSDRPVRILLQRVPGDDGERIWKFSNATIAELDILYEEYRYTAYVEWLAEILPEISFLGIGLFKWAALASMLALVAPMVLLLAWWLARLMVAPDRPMHPPVRRFLLGPVSVVVLIIVAQQTLLSLGIGLVAQQIARTHTLSTAAVIWLLWQAVNLVREFYSNLLVRRGRESSVPLLRPLASACKLLILLLGVLVWLDNLGYQITAVLTGLGIGGIAVALVLQKPLEDVFGAITLYTQQPIRIGDFGRFGSHTGTVEEISLRTTRIRTLANTLVSVPNMRLASEPIENLSAREKFLYQPLIRLRSDTDAAQLKEILERVRALLAANEQVYDEGARVRFTTIGPISHDLGVFAYVDAPDWAGYLAVAESLNFAILEVLEELGVAFAIPLGDVIEAGQP
jgi:MscS family membrane protein